MKIAPNIKKRKVPLAPVEDGEQSMLEDEAPLVAEEVAAIEDEPAEKAAVKAVKPARKILTLADIDEDTVYGLYCYGNARFGCHHRPALGSEIRKYRDRSDEYGVVRYYAPGTKRLTETGTLHQAPKGDFLIKLSEEFFAAAQLWLGSYTPEEAERSRVLFKFPKLSERERRALSLRMKRLAEEKAAKIAKARKPLKLKFK